MKKLSRYFLAALLVPAAIACGKTDNDDPTPEPGPGPEPQPEARTVTVQYTRSDENFPNPERGFYVGGEVYAATGTGITEASMKVNRNQGRTLYLLEFHMGNYVDTDIAEDYLATIRAKFESLRIGGFKCILRFCYSNGFDESDKPWDATPEQALRHIAQVKPLIQEFYDVIMVVQAGFIGSWGEWYYTENYNDNADRKKIVDALLDAVPADRQIELRTPAFKQQLYGFSATDTLTAATAHQPTIQARLGGHNDCYLANTNDQGTYRGNSDRKYWSAESRFTIMGGESCQVSNYCHCERQSDKVPGALIDLATNHFTYLNNGYHQNVLKRWRDEGCMDEIKLRLGYRYILEEGEFTKEAKAGSAFEIKLTLRNDGFAPAQNPRDAELVLCDASGKVVKTWKLDSDPRYWLPEEKTVINQTLTLPEGLSGTYTLYMNLPDPCETLHQDPRFSIRLANTGTWNEETGYNTLYSFTL